MVTNDANLVWTATLDDCYLIRVVRTGEYTGDFIISNTANDNKELLREPVGLAYNALFGPDVADVAAWQDRAVQFVDEEIAVRCKDGLPHETIMGSEFCLKCGEPL